VTTSKPRACGEEGKTPAGPAPVLEVTVHGRPEGQGNLKGGAGGRLRHANSTRLRAWRDLIAWHVMQETGRHYHTTAPRARRDGPCALCRTPRARHALLLGAVALDALIVVPAPATVTRPYPTTRSASDWDHYARAVSDALTGLVYVDDSQIVDGRLRKAYPGPGTLPEPGAVIRVWEVP